MALLIVLLLTIVIVAGAIWMVSNTTEQERNAEEEARSPAGRTLPSRRYTVVSNPLSQGRYGAYVKELPGFTAYGDTAQAARTKASALALHLLAARIADGEMSLQGVQFVMRAETDPETDEALPSEHLGKRDSVDMYERSSHTHGDRFQRRAKDAIDATVRCGVGVEAPQPLQAGSRAHEI